ncbi:MAG: MMPL family transporter [Planctomycetes bacterium]|nr:MMPL family transporter [Planctomycetota bacterium]
MRGAGEDDERGAWARLARRVVARPGRAAAVLLVTGLAALLLGRARLVVSADRTDLLGRQHAYARSFGDLQDDFGDVDSIVVLVSAPAREAALGFAADLAAAAAAPGAPFRGAFYGVPDEALQGKALLFLDLADLEEVERRLTAAAGALVAFGEGGAGGLLEHAAARVRALVAAAGADAGPEAGPDDLALLAGLVDALSEGLAGGAAPRGPPWRELIPAGIADRDGYVWTRDGRLVLLVEPRARAGPERLAAVEALRALVDARRAAWPGVTAGLTGNPVLEADELATFVHDARRATVAALLGLVVLLAASLRRVVIPLLVLLGLVWAVVVTLGVAALWPGHLNLVTVVVGALILGIGADGALHLVARHAEARAAERRPARGRRPRAGRGGRRAAAAALTMILAFLATLFTEVEGVRELGVLAGLGLGLCLAASLALVPPLVAWADPPGRPPRHRPAGWRLARLDALVERRPAAVLLAATGLAAAGVALALTPQPDGRPRLRYEPNLLRLQAQSLESVRLASELLADEGVTGMFAAVVVEDLPSLVRVEAAVSDLPTVARAESLLDVVPPDQEEKLAVVRRLAATLARVAPALAGPPPHGLAAAERGAEALQAALEEAARGALAAGRAPEASPVLRLQERLEALAPRPAEPPAARARRAAALGAWEAAWRADLRAALERLEAECAARPVTVDDLPAEVRARFVGKTGRLLLRVYPAPGEVDVWARAGRERFLSDLRRVVPDVGGFPVQLHESDRLLTAGVRRAGLLAVAFAALVLLAHFRSPLVPLVAAATLLVGAGLALGVLALLGAELNPANLLAAPLALGVGVGQVIHLARREREARAVASVGGPQPVLGTSAGRGVVLSGLAALVAFGALGLADHRGLATLGRSACLGAAACMAAALVVTPALLRLRAGPWRAPPREGLRGPKTGPGGAPRRPPEEEAEVEEDEDE